MDNNWSFWSRVHGTFAAAAELLLLGRHVDAPECVMRFSDRDGPRFVIEMKMVDGWPAGRVADIESIDSEDVRWYARLWRNQLVEAAAQMLREDRDRQAVPSRLSRLGNLLARQDELRYRGLRGCRRLTNAEARADAEAQALLGALERPQRAERRCVDGDCPDAYCPTCLRAILAAVQAFMALVEVDAPRFGADFPRDAAAALVGRPPHRPEILAGES